MSFSAVAFAAALPSEDVDANAIVGACAADLQAKVHAARAQLATCGETVNQYRRDGVYTPDRAALHRRIIGAILTPDALVAARPVAEAPTFTVLGGRGGSGKSWFKGRLYDASTAIVIDPDEIKAQLPEYAGWNAFQVHEEATDITEALLLTTRALGLNVVLDITLKSEAAAVSKVNAFLRAGYLLELHYMHLPPPKAARRALERFAASSGRFVPPEVVLGNVTNEATFDRVRALAHRWSFWSNDVERDAPPLQVACSPGLTLTSTPPGSM